MRRRNELYTPYEKQKEFHKLGATKRERVLSAGNQLGKSTAGAAEVVCHLTGIYPEGWEGKRFDKPTRFWASGVTSQSTRDGPQKKIVGDNAKAAGTGLLSSDYINGISFSRGIPDAVDTMRIKHISGGESYLKFMSYEMGREKWQAETLDGVWFDEEPEIAIYTEGLSRTNATGGIVFLTFTPLKGMSDVVMKFWKEHSSQRALVMMGINDALHISAEQKQIIIDSYPAHERKARVEGIPVLGSGRVFPVSREEIAYNKLADIPAHWARIVGMDFGWDHPTAAAWLAWDRDGDTIYVYDTYRKSESPVLEHAAAIRSKGKWIPVAWPHDGLQHDKGSGEQLAEQYRKLDVNMLAEKATFEDGSNGVEAGVADMLDRMKTGRLKVAAHLTDWFEEFELYHRKDGKLYKERDDLISATRYGIMMLRHAETSKQADDWNKPLKMGKTGIF